MKNEKFSLIKMLAETIPIPNELDDENDYWQHSIHIRFEANRKRIIRRNGNKNPIGSLHQTGYYYFNCRDDNYEKIIH